MSDYEDTLANQAADPAAPYRGLPADQVPWTPVVQDIAAQHPEMSEGQIWAAYTNGWYTPQPNYPNNPFTPVVYVAPDAQGNPDYTQFGNPTPAPTGHDASGGGGGPDPYALARQREIIRQAMMRARVVPGLPFSVGVLPEGPAISLLNFMPLNEQNPDEQARHYFDDPVARRLAEIASHSASLPLYKDQRYANRLPGRGFELTGQASPEEAALSQALLHNQPVNLNRLAQLRGSRYKVPARDVVDKFMRPLTLAAIATGTALLGGAAALPAMTAAGLGAGAGIGAGAVGGAAGSAWTQALANQGHVDPATVGFGAAGGALAPTASRALGPILGPTLSGAGMGAANAARQGGDTGAIATGALSGAAGGAAGGGLQAVTGNPFLSQIGGAEAGTLGGAAGNYLWGDSRQRRRNPFA